MTKTVRSGVEPLRTVQTPGVSEHTGTSPWPLHKKTSPPGDQGVDFVNTLRKNEIFHFFELHHFPVTFGDGRSEAAFTRLEVRGRPKGPRRTGTPTRRSRGWGEKENDKGSGHLGRSSNRQSRFCGLNMKGLRPLHASPNGENRFVNDQGVDFVNTQKAPSVKKRMALYKSRRLFPNSPILRPVLGRGEPGLFLEYPVKIGGVVITHRAADLGRGHGGVL